MFYRMNSPMAEYPKDSIVSSVKERSSGLPINKLKYELK